MRDAVAPFGRLLDFARQGIRNQLRRYAPVGDRALGIDADPEYLGWRASETLLERLADAGRIYPVPAGFL